VCALTGELTSGMSGAGRGSTTGVLEDDTSFIATLICSESGTASYIHCLSSNATSMREHHSMACLRRRELSCKALRDKSGELSLMS